MKTGLIYQPGGLGDILFLQKLAYHMKDEGYEVYWPVLYELEWLNNYITDFHFVSWGDRGNLLTAPPLPDSVVFPYKELYSPQKRTEITKDLFYFNGFMTSGPVMSGKYDDAGLDWKDWSRHIDFKRNAEKEDALYYDVLGLRDDEEFVFVNRTYRLRPTPHWYPSIPVDENHYKCRVVELKIVDGFSAFDWCKVFEKSKEVNMIATSINFIMESPQLFDVMKTKKLNLHHRDNNWSDVDYLFQLPWQYN